MQIDELTALRKRVKEQRAELRRLNNQIRNIWRGWHYHNYVQATIEIERLKRQATNSGERKP